MIFSADETTNIGAGAVALANRLLVCESPRALAAEVKVAE